MSTKTSRLSPSSDSARETRVNHSGSNVEQKKRIVASALNYALIGAGASLLLGILEFVDVNIRFSPVFESFSERAIFGAYFSLNLTVGLLIGLVVGLIIESASILQQIGERLIAKFGNVRVIHRVIVLLGVSGFFAVVLNQQPQIHGHVREIIREAEKFEALRTTLLNHERSTSYLLLMTIVVASALLMLATRRLSSSPLVAKATGLIALVVVLACGYYVDSRFETPLYETAIHRSMFLLCTALCMSLIGIIAPRPSRTRKNAIVLAGIVVSGGLVFLFTSFDKNQNLKTLLFYRTTQARQHFKLAQWILDFDRDGYSSLLGGGDCDDRRGDINPGRPEIAGGGADYNCIGGELSYQSIDDWHGESRSLHRPPQASAKRLNVIHIFIDALRPDHLGLYGYSRNTSPNLDKLATRSSVFKNAYTPAPNTFEALPKFTQGTYWDAHIQGWPQIMARNGYEALLFPRRISTLRRHIRGMKVVEGARDGTFEATIDSAINVLGNVPSDRPFCAYLYSTDTHRPYKQHDEFYFGSSMIDLYDGEIAYMDFHLGRLFDWMEKAGKMDDTMIVIMADHGESLGERGVFKHSTLLYNEQSRVPMIIFVPGYPARSVDDYVSTIDLGPTMLEAVGLDYPTECTGVSLVPIIRGEPFTHPPVYGEQTTQEVSPYVRPEQNISPPQKKYMIITQDGFKLIFNRDHYTFELFDLKSDPLEVRNLFDRLPDRALEMKNRLGRFIDIVTVSRPWDADESQYFFGPTGETREAK